MSQQPFSYWERELHPLKYDLVVIGAGIVGLTAALLFKRRHTNRRVVVIERGAIPEGASTRNAGFACVGSITEHLADIEKVGEEAVKERIRMRFEGLRKLKETLGKEDIGYRACGGAELFTSDEAFRMAEEQLGRFNGWLKKLTGEKGVYSADRMNGYPVVRNRLEGSLHPGKMIRTLVSFCRREGVEIRWLHQAEGLPEPGTVELKDSGTLKAGRVLVATNGFTRRLIPGLTVRPARGYIFMTGELDTVEWRGTFHHDRGYIYFRDVGNRLLLGGARNVDVDREFTDLPGVNKKVKRKLVSFAEEVLNLPEGWEIDREWNGIMGFTDTKTPLVEARDERTVVAAGLSGMGIAIGMKVAEQAVGLLGD